MIPETEVLTALSSAFRTGYDIGYLNGCWVGACITVGVMVLINALTHTVQLLRTWHKGRLARAQLAAARADFKRQQSKP